MSEIRDRLIANIRNYEPESPEREAAVKRVYYGWDFFSKLTGLDCNYPELARKIYRRYLEMHSQSRRRKIVGVYWQPVGPLEKIPVKAGPLRAPERESYKRQASIIARHLYALNSREPSGETAAKETLSVPAPNKPALAGDRIQVGRRWFDLTEEEQKVLQILFEANGAWVSGKVFSNRNVHKVIRRMDPRVRQIIESGRKGYRIHSLLSA